MDFADGQFAVLVKRLRIDDLRTLEAWFAKVTFRGNRFLAVSFGATNACSIQPHSIIQEKLVFSSWS